MTNRMRLTCAIGAVGLIAMVMFIMIPNKATYDVRIVTPPSIIASLPHWIAEEEGLYTKEGVSVHSLSFNDSRNMISALAQGDADFLPAVSLFDTTTYVNEVDASSLYIVSHSMMTKYPAFEALITLPDSSVKSLKGLEGKTIGVYPGETAALVVEKYLESLGVDTSSITFQPLPPPSHITSLQGGDLAASHAYETLKTRLLSMGGVALSEAIYPSLDIPAVGVSVISSRLTEDPEKAEALLRAWDAAIRFISEHPQQARSILAKRLSITDSDARKAVWVNATKHDETKQEIINESVDSMRELGVLSHDYNEYPLVYNPSSSNDL